MAKARRGPPSAPSAPRVRVASSSGGGADALMRSGAPLSPPRAAPAAVSPPQPLASRRKKKVLILISDTGGGHRASAQALAAVLAQRHGDDVETEIVDVWTEYGPWPIGEKMVPYYRGLAQRPALWYAHFKATALKPTCYVFSQMLTVLAYRGFEACIKEYTPDVVVSMHPLCQAVPIKVLRAMHKRRVEEASVSKQYVPKRIPHVTVVTDLATPHPLWLHPRTDLCFVPSDSFVRAALVRGLKTSQLRDHGLPVRPSFASKPESCVSVDSLGLLPGRRTVLLVGGGDGVGRLGAIVDAMQVRLTELNLAGGPPAQMVVICGKNHALREELQQRDWGGDLHVVVEGFVTRMSEYMIAADCIVTKAGPGTIAEACCCGLPIMLSGYLPGQETGNVAFVVDGGFGGYSNKPEVIASTVASWLEDPQLLKAMSEHSQRASRPAATGQIADDIVKLITAEPQRPQRWEAAMAKARALTDAQKKARLRRQGMADSAGAAGVLVGGG